MKVRALDANGDWTFGKGKSNYKKDKDALAQSIKTRLKSFLNNCFFDMDAGIDWFNLNGSKQLLQARIEISTVILNTNGVTLLNELSVTISTNRNMLIMYSVETIYGKIDSEVTI